MKNQKLDPMTCELHVGDVCEVISSKSKYIAEIVEISGVSCPFKLRTETFCFIWRNRSELRLVERNGQPINQPEKTMKTSEQLQNLSKNVASLVEAISEAADMAEYFEANENGENALREINKKLGDRVDELESKLQAQSRAYHEQIRGLNAQIAGLEEQKQIQHKRNHELLEHLKAVNALLETQRELLNTPGYVNILAYVSEFSAKHQLSTAAVWDMFFSVCKRAVFTIPEAPEPVEPPVTDDFKECRGGFDCNLVPCKTSPQDLLVSEDDAMICTLNVGDIVEIVNYDNNETNVKNGHKGFIKEIGTENSMQFPYIYKVEKFKHFYDEDDSGNCTWFRRENIKFIS